MRNKISVLLVILLTSLSARAVEINYAVSFPQPQTHYADVVMQMNGCAADFLDVKMPVWIPGSYMIREFPRFVDVFEAYDKNGKVLSAEKVDKNTWRIQSSGVSSIKVHYQVYAFELSVRTSFVDEEHAFLNGSSIFMFVEDYLNNPVTVTISPAPSWKVISVALERVSENNPWKLKAPNYDELVDAPFEIGNHLVFTFTAAGVPHEVAMFGEGNFDVDRLKKDMSRIVDECTKVFGSHPGKRYVFFIHNLINGGGGLEHKNSTSIQVNKWGYSNSSSYIGFLSLVAHEYFHLWNVKRLRPVPLGPFNYSEENYTNLLWLAEGFTAYYDDMIVYRCGFMDEAEYLRTIAGSMSYCNNQMGAAFQSLSESSMDAWIKYYRSYENSSNASVSYYTKGSVVGALLDMEIINATNGNKSLDDFMKEMYHEFYVKNEKAFTQEDVMKMVEKISGKNMDSFFKDAVNSTLPLPMEKVVAELGLSLDDLNKKSTTTFSGINASATNGKLMVTSIVRNSPAWTSGINVNDELIAMDQYRFGDDLSKLISMKAPGDKVTFLVNRSGYIKSIALTLANTPYVKYSLNKSSAVSEQKSRNYKKWLD
ncbi:MAG: M61 family metallopeptidase [Bacteroidetes bacterium]|nr:M61 family metallopeptidase [Bacteroidota bacterium]